MNALYLEYGLEGYAEQSKQLMGHGLTICTMGGRTVSYMNEAIKHLQTKYK